MRQIQAPSPKSQTTTEPERRQEKTGALQKLRHFEGYWNLAPASWNLAVPSAAFSWDLDFGIYLEVGCWTWNV